MWSCFKLKVLGVKVWAETLEFAAMFPDITIIVKYLSENEIGKVTVLSPAGKPTFPLFHCSISPVTLFLHQWPCSFEPYSNRFAIKIENHIFFWWVRTMITF